MKPLHLNLASRPYRDYRPVYAVVVVTSLLVAFLMLNNIDTYYQYILDTKNTRAKIAQLQAKTEQERRLGTTAQQRVQSINLVALSRQTKFVNSQIAERAFSWSELLDRIEGILADNVRVTSISPSFTKEGIVHLTLDCEAKTADGLVQTIDHFNRDPHFSNPFPNVETLQPSGGYRFGLSVDYKPTFVRAVPQ